MNTKKHLFTEVIKKSADQYVILCLELCVVGSGYTKDEARKNLMDAIDSYLEYAEETDLPTDRPISIGELHEFLIGEKELPPSDEHELHIRILEYA